MSNTTLLAILSIASGVLLSGGALAWFIRSGTDMRIAQMNAVDAKKKSEELAITVGTLQTQVAQHETVLTEIRSMLHDIQSQLGKFAGLATAIEFIRDTVRTLPCRNGQITPYCPKEKEN